jgi:hypothetical protein
MNRIRIVFAISVSLVGAGVGAAVGPAVDAQEVKQPPDLRMLLTQPQNRVTQDAAGVPNLRDLPQPKMDKPPVEPPITIILGDPRCYPGEDGLGDFGQANRRRRR